MGYGVFDVALNELEAGASPDDLRHDLEAAIEIVEDVEAKKEKENQ